MGRAATTEGEKLNGAVVKPVSLGPRKHRNSRLLLTLDVPAGDADARSVAESLMLAVPSNRESAVLTCFSETGRPAVFRWDASEHPQSRAPRHASCTLMSVRPREILGQLLAWVTTDVAERAQARPRYRTFHVRTSASRRPPASYPVRSERTAYYGPLHED